MDVTSKIAYIKAISEDYLFTYSEAYANELTKFHDEFLQSNLETGSYHKLYSFKHIVNGVAIHTTPSQVLPIFKLVVLLIIYFYINHLHLSTPFKKVIFTKLNIQVATNL